MRLVKFYALVFSYIPFAGYADTSIADSVCHPSLSSELCEHAKEILADVAFANPKDAEDALAKIVKKLELKLKDKDFVIAAMSSKVVKDKLNQLPFDATFKVIDIEDGDSLLALEFGYNYEFSRNTYNQEGNRAKSYAFDFDLTGTATQNDEENPRNFIDSSLSFSFSSRPNFSNKQVMSALFDQGRLSECRSNRDLEGNQECFNLEKLAFDKLFEPAGFTYYLDYGLDMGYETDQSFDAKNATFGFFGSISLHDYAKTTFMGINGIEPSIRFAIESVEPSSETPRAMAGDESSYERISAEFHISVPLVELLNLPYLLSFNYRTFDELGASNLVKDADLDSYRLRTYALSAPTGIVISYSSGRLPFGFEDQKTVELGFKMYF